MINHDLNLFKSCGFLKEVLRAAFDGLPDMHLGSDRRNHDRIYIPVKLFYLTQGSDAILYRHDNVKENDMRSFRFVSINRRLTVSNGKDILDTALRQLVSQIFPCKERIITD